MGINLQEWIGMVGMVICIVIIGMTDFLYDIPPWLLFWIAAFYWKDAFK